MKQYFQIDPCIIHLNHAAVAPWPVATAQALQAFAQENASIGSQRYEHWLQCEDELRSKLARLINVENAEDIALLKSTSEGLSFIAYGLQWNAGDNIIIPEGEFPSNRVVWESLANQGVEVRQVSIKTDDHESALINAFDERTRLLSVSSVQYADGFRLQLETLGKACRKSHVLFCIDAIQSLGMLPFDQTRIGADFIVADGHKWMLGPEGLALFYCKPEVRDQLTLHEFGWHMVEQVGVFDNHDWQPASSARRFECGSPNTTAVMALNASLDVLFEVGMDQVETLILHNSDYLQRGLAAIAGVTILSPQITSRRSGIVNFRVDDIDMEALYAHCQQQGILCALRGGGIRFSPHFHTTELQLQTAIDKVANYLLKGL